jgi:hypothetical protein
MVVLIKSISFGATISFPSKCVYISDCTEGLCSKSVFSCEI